MRAVLNVSLPQELYTEIDDAVSCHEFENKSQLVQTLISQWSVARHRRLHQAEARQQKTLRYQATIKHTYLLLALGAKNVKNDFVQIGRITTSFIIKVFKQVIRLLAKGIKLIGFFFILIGRSTRICLIAIGRDFRHTTASVLRFALHFVDKKPAEENQVLYTRRQTPPPTC